MKLASKGLGKITLPFRFTEALISEAPDCLVLEGVIKEKKVNWTYRAEVEDSDLLNFVILARDPLIVGYITEQLGLALFGSLLRAAAALAASPFRRRSADARIAGSRGSEPETKKTDAPSGARTAGARGA